MLKDFKIIVNDVCVFEDNIDVIFQNERLINFKQKIIRSTTITFKTDKSDELDKIIALCILQENKKIMLENKEFYWNDSIDINEIPKKTYNFFLEERASV